MVIKQLTANVYDIEVFPNCFHCTVRDTEENTYHTFEISCRKHEVDLLCDYFLKENAIFVGYNNHHYDDLIINYIIEYREVMRYKSHLDICKSLFNMSQKIIALNDDESLRKTLSHWKYAKLFKSMDILSMLFSEKLRVGLKEMQMTMHYENVKEYEGDFESFILEKDIDKMIEYNINDVDSTTELLNRCKKDIDLRLWIEQEYGINALSMDSVKFGETLLLKRYCERTGLSPKYVKTLRSPMDYIPMQEVVFPIISYSNPILKDVLLDMKSQVVSSKERKGYDKQFVLSGTQYSIGVGGIHSINTPGIYVSSEDEYIGHADVTSMYPSLIIQYGLVPRHLGKEFLEDYSQIYGERVEAKHSGQKNKNTALKLVLNSVTGKMQQEVSWLYDPLMVFRIRINGQLILLMLVERLLNLDCKIIQVNTDGVMYIAKKGKEKQVQVAISEVESLTKLSFETGCYEAFYQYAVNDYFGVIEGYSVSRNPELIETKGMFITTTKMGKGLAPTIIPKAVINYFIDGTPIQETIMNCTDIKEFLIGQRVAKDFKVEHNGKLVRRINRFYASTNGAYLFKYKEDADGRHYQNMLTKSGVTILNEFDDKPISERKINYRYYMAEANKIVKDLRDRELDLF